MKYDLFLFSPQSSVVKLSILILTAIFLNACTGESTGNNSSNNTIIVVNSNDIAPTPTGANMNSNQTFGGETMVRDSTVPGRFNCRTGEEIILEFLPTNTTAPLNYEFKNENLRGIISDNKLTFIADRNRDLSLLFNFNGKKGSYKIIFRTKSGTIIDDEMPVRQPLSAVPKRIDYEFKVSN